MGNHCCNVKYTFLACQNEVLVSYVTLITWLLVYNLISSFESVPEISDGNSFLYALLSLFQKNCHTLRVKNIISIRNDTSMAGVGFHELHLDLSH